jgi:hypothetical protein
VLPVTIAAMVTLSVSATETKATQTFQQPEKPVAKNDTTPEPSMTITLDSSLNLPTAEKIKKKLPGNLLYIINGKVASVDEVSKLKPEQIKSINVWKEKAAAEKYGAAGANGVIEIVLKELALR